MLKSLVRLIPLALGLTLSAFADHHETGKAEPAGHLGDGGSLFKTTFLGNFEYTTGHVVQLAEAIPADTYDWAPAEGIRSVEKAILHIVAANYMLGAKLGGALPQDVDPQAIEGKRHDKDAAVKALKDSIAFAKQAISAFPEDKLGDEVDFYGMKMNNMAIVLIIGGHANEHLGQLIAYARSNGITPPWSQ